MNKNKSTEADEQIKLFQWRDLHIGRYPELVLLIHIPNGGYRDKAEAAKFKRMGVKSGVSDLLLPVARNNWHGLWIELKSDNGKLSDNQIKWLEDMRRQGYKAVVCYGFDDAVKVLLEYLK